MNIFFSGTDTGELYGNADKFDYYLSLIVGFNMEYKARVAIFGNHKFERTYKGGFKGRNVEIVLKNEDESTEKESCLSMECDIEMEVSEPLKKRYIEIEESKKKPVYTHHNYNNYGGSNNYGGIYTGKGGANSPNYAEFDWSDDWNEQDFGQGKEGKGYHKGKSKPVKEEIKNPTLFDQLKDAGAKLFKSSEPDRLIVLKTLQKTLNVAKEGTLDVQSCLAAISKLKKEIELPMALDLIEQSFEDELRVVYGVVDQSNDSLWRAVRAYNIAIDIVHDKKYNNYKNIKDVQELFVHGRKYYADIMEARQTRLADSTIHD